MRSFLLQMEVVTSAESVKFTSQPIYTAAEALEKYRALQMRYPTSIILNEEKDGLSFIREVGEDELRQMAEGAYQSKTWPEVRDATYERMLVDAIIERKGSLRQAIKDIETSRSEFERFLKRRGYKGAEDFYQAHGIRPNVKASRKNFPNLKPGYDIV